MKATRPKDPGFCEMAPLAAGADVEAVAALVVAAPAAPFVAVVEAFEPAAVVVALVPEDDPPAEDPVAAGAAPVLEAVKEAASSVTLAERHNFSANWRVVAISAAEQAFLTQSLIPVMKLFALQIQATSVAAHPVLLKPFIEHDTAQVGRPERSWEATKEAVKTRKTVENFMLLVV